jgi:hypothetical protein
MVCLTEILAYIDEKKLNFFVIDDSKGRTKSIECCTKMFLWRMYVDGKNKKNLRFHFALKQRLIVYGIL